MTKGITAAVLTGHGINCERELALGCRLAGAEVTFVHVQELLQGKFPWDKVQLLLLPGGFSFGDELGAAKALASRLLYHSLKIKERLQQFVNEGGAILGICNGFQLLVKMGLLPQNPDGKQLASLACNDAGKFVCRWVQHTVCPSPCIFTQGLETLYLPIRHGEGKFVCDEALLKSLQEKGQVVLQYSERENPNGSLASIAAVCDSTGRICGMMAHPEAALFFTHYPDWTRRKERAKREGKPIPSFGEGLYMLQNGIQTLRKYG